MPLPVGSIAPDFTLRHSLNGELVDASLSDHKGKENVVLLFFPGAFTSVCEAELCGVSVEMSEYEGLHSAVYGVSGDTPFALAAWAKHAGISIPLLADYQRTVTKAYEATWPDFAGLGEGVARAAFVIDKAGVIRYSEQTPTLRDIPNLQALKQCLASLP